MTAKAFVFTKLEVADIAVAERFYTEALGFEVTARVNETVDGAQMTEIILKTAGARQGAPCLMLTNFAGKTVPGAGAATVGFMVENVDAAVERAVAAGATLDIAPVDAPQYHLRVAFLRDPAGHIVELLQPLAG
jgi:Uncharacterized protein conserved in bacteria